MKKLYSLLIMLTIVFVGVSIAGGPGWNDRLETTSMVMMGSLDGFAAVNLHGVDSVNADAWKTPVDMLAYDGAGLVVVSCAKALRGTNPTLSIVLKTSSDNFVADSTTVKTFTGVTTSASNQSYLINIGAQKRYWRIYYDIGGTANPCYYVGVKVIARTKYN